MPKNLTLLRRWWPLGLCLTTNGLLFIPTPPSLHYAAALILLAFLPGWVWLQAFFDPRAASSSNLPEQTSPPPDPLERVVLAVGLSLALTILTMMFSVYLPGAISFTALLLAIDTVTGLGLILLWRQPSSLQAERSTFNLKRFNLTSTTLILGLGLIFLAAALRLPHLGYAEFHEDEAEALMLGVRLMQGEDYALFLHRKGPAQMLLPLAFWLLTGQITEGMARFPFTLSSILSVYTIFVIGRRWFNGWAGVIAALLWAVNGYSIAFGRMVQYQALIFFLGPLALYCLYLARATGRQGDKVTRWQGGKWLVLGAILLAVCLLAHFDALMLLPAAAYLGWLSLNSRDIDSPSPLRSPALWRNPQLWVAITAFLVFIGLLAAFYVPYLLDPEFKNTADYLAGSRVKPGLLYNNLDLLRHLDQVYSSRFYLPLLIVGMVAMAIWSIHRGVRQKLGVEAVAAWLMFGAGFVGYTFLVDDPRTHLYIMYPGAVLLAGAGFTIYDLRINLWRSLVAVIITIALCFVVVYEMMIFLPAQSTLERLRQAWDGSLRQIIYADLPPDREYFGYPKNEGWKAIGALRAQGLFPGDFRSINEEFIIPIWYNYGQARSCYDTPSQFFVRAPGIEVYIPIQQIERYDEVAWVQREGETRLRIFSAKNLPGGSQASGKIVSPTLYILEEWEHAFDQQATPEHFIRQAEPAQPVVSQFGPAIEFRGFDLPQSSVAPGDTLLVNLHWRALQPPGGSYRAFVHLTDGSNLWGQQDDDPACRLPTSIWRAGQRSLGQFRLLIKPETPPGRYPLIIGLYRADTLERLKITAGAGKTGDDFLWLGDVEVRVK